jgi:hypothetical protein
VAFGRTGEQEIAPNDIGNTSIPIDGQKSLIDGQKCLIQRFFENSCCALLSLAKRQRIGGSLMANPRKKVGFNLPEPTFKVLERLCKVFDRSQAKAVEIALRLTEKNWLRHRSEEQKRRYLDRELDRDEADEIIQRAKATSQPKPQPLAGVP